MNDLIEIYNYREMIISLVKRDLKGRYKGSVLGFLWTFINPLMQLVVYTIVFSVIMRAGIKDYYMFLFVALVPWIFFSTSIAGGANCIRAQQSMVQKIYFPREVLPISFVTTQFINMMLSFIVVLLVAIVTGRKLSVFALLCLPVIWIVEYILALGITLLTSAITVYFRDLEYLLGIITMAWQFLTPVMYSIDQVPKGYKWVFAFNPMTYVIVAYRDILYYGRVPNFTTLFSSVIIGILFLVVGWIVFRDLQKHFVEEL